MRADKAFTIKPFNSLAPSAGSSLPRREATARPNNLKRRTPVRQRSAKVQLPQRDRTRPHNQRVAGSSPAGHTNKIRHLQQIKKSRNGAIAILDPYWIQIRKFRMCHSQILVSRRSPEFAAHKIMPSWGIGEVMDRHRHARREIFAHIGYQTVR